jgi:hypothetical protein
MVRRSFGFAQGFGRAGTFAAHKLLPTAIAPLISPNGPASGVEPEGSDIDEPDDVGGFLTERGHDLAAVRVARDDRRAVLELEHFTEPRDVVGKRIERELGRPHLKILGL